MAEPALKKQKQFPEENSDEDDTTEEDTPKEFIATFERQNITLIVENKKLFLWKEDFMTESGVFRTNFTSQYKDASLKEIPLSGKTLCHFVSFLLCLIPSFSDELSVKTVQYLLPLVDEYQANKLKRRIDQFLADYIKEQGDTIKSEQIIMHILQAGQYDLHYLDECIHVASRKKIQYLCNFDGFRDTKMYQPRNSDENLCY